MKKSSKKKRGRPLIAKPKANVLKVRLDDADYLAVIGMSSKEGLTSSEWVRRAIREKINN